ncbi:hypothetical protein ACP70R_044383 [Stipagrostis hirtigluma subsp. patula]
MVRPRGKPSQGRKRIEIRRIDDRERRQVTFSKRKAGLLKKACELSVLSGNHLALVIFSSASKAYGLGSPSVAHVLRRFAPLPGHEAAPAPEDDADAVADRPAVEATLRLCEETKARVAEEQARMDAIADKVLQASAGGFWWEADVEALGEAELKEHARALQRLKDNVRRRADTLLSASQPPAPSLPVK